jgi:hypothetical protein
MCIVDDKRMSRLSEHKQHKAFQQRRQLWVMKKRIRDQRPVNNIASLFYMTNTASHFRSASLFYKRSPLSRQPPRSVE